MCQDRLVYAMVTNTTKSLRSGPETGGGELLFHIIIQGPKILSSTAAVIPSGIHDLFSY